MLTPKTVVRVLICEDSLPVSQLLVEIINNHSEGDNYLTVVGVAGNGQEAIALTRRLKPDVITMDARMPGLDGLEATRQIMAEQPTPIVLVSAIAEAAVALSMAALAAGALVVLPKPTGPGQAGFAENAQKLRQTLCTMAGVKLVRRWIPTTGTKTQPTSILPSPPIAAPTSGFTNSSRLVAIGASTGGPSALATILSQLLPEFNWPILITQHIMPGFGAGLARWLRETTGRMVVMAEEGQVIKPASGLVIIAPDNCHLVYTPQGLRFNYTTVPNGMKPSVDIMFESIAKHLGAAAIGVILTGMGKDGAVGLQQMREAGALTIAQDEASCVVFGMPKEAVLLGAAVEVLALNQITPYLNKIFDPC